MGGVGPAATGGGAFLSPPAADSLHGIVGSSNGGADNGAAASAFAYNGENYPPQQQQAHTAAQSLWHGGAGAPPATPGAPHSTYQHAIHHHPPGSYQPPSHSSYEPLHTQHLHARHQAAYYSPQQPPFFGTPGGAQQQQSQYATSWAHPHSIVQQQAAMARAHQLAQQQQAEIMQQQHQIATMHAQQQLATVAAVREAEVQSLRDEIAQLRVAQTAAATSPPPPPPPPPQPTTPRQPDQEPRSSKRKDLPSDTINRLLEKSGSLDTPLKVQPWLRQIFAIAARHDTTLERLIGILEVNPLDIEVAKHAITSDETLRVDDKWLAGQLLRSVTRGATLTILEGLPRATQSSAISLIENILSVTEHRLPSETRDERTDYEKRVFFQPGQCSLNQITIAIATLREQIEPTEAFQNLKEDETIRESYIVDQVLKKLPKNAIHDQTRGTTVEEELRRQIDQLKLRRATSSTATSRRAR